MHDTHASVCFHNSNDDDDGCDDTSYYLTMLIQLHLSIYIASASGEYTSTQNERTRHTNQRELLLQHRSALRIHIWHIIFLSHHLAIDCGRKVRANERK